MSHVNAIGMEKYPKYLPSQYSRYSRRRSQCHPFSEQNLLHCQQQITMKLQHIIQQVNSVCNWPGSDSEFIMCLRREESTRRFKTQKSDSLVFLILILFATERMKKVVSAISGVRISTDYWCHHFRRAITSTLPHCTPQPASLWAPTLTHCPPTLPRCLCRCWHSNRSYFQRDEFSQHKIYSIGDSLQLHFCSNTSDLVFV